jgi:hypothetical protein
MRIKASRLTELAACSCVRSRSELIVHFGAAKLLDARTADSSSTNAVNFSSARATKRFPLSRCASTIQIVRPLESIAETQPQLQPSFAEIVSDDFPELHVDRIVPLLVSTQQSQNDMNGRNDAGLDPIPLYTQSLLTSFPSPRT